MSVLPLSRCVRRGASAFTLVELLAVIAIVGILAAIIIPIVGKARASAQNTQCVSRLRDWGRAVFLAAADNGGKYQISNWASAASNPYRAYFGGQETEAVKFFGGCPLVNQTLSNSSMCYSFVWPSINGDINSGMPEITGQNQFISMRQIAQPVNFLVMCDTMKGTSPRIRGTAADFPNDFAQMINPLFGAAPQNTATRGDETVSLRHGGGHINGVFADGSVRRITGTAAGSGDRDSIYEMRSTWFLLN